MARARIGTMEVDLTLSTGRFTRGAEQAKAAARGLGTRLRETANRSISLTHALAGLAAAGFAAKEIFELGAAVEETGSKFNTVFGEEAGSVQTAIDQFADLAGLSKQAAQEVTATTGAIVQGFGLSERAAAALSVEASRLAGDLASFNNVPVAETARAIQAGLTGEMESLKRLGIAVLDADVKQRALVMTGKTLQSELTAGEVVMARFALITERAGVQVGDMVRTQDTAAARARVLVSELKSLRDEMAAALLPVLAFVVERTLEFVKGIQILGAETAVLIARFNFWKEALLGTEDSMIAANDELRRMRVAAQQVKDEIIGLNVQTGEFNTTAQNMATVLEEVAGGGGAVPQAEVAFKDMASALTTALPPVDDLSDGMRMLEGATSGAASQVERLNSATAKLSAVASLFRFIPGLGGAAGIVGQVAGFVGAVSGARNAFSNSASGAAVPTGPPASTSSGASFSIVLPPAPDPITLANDQRWLRALAESNLNLSVQGAR